MCGETVPIIHTYTHARLSYLAFRLGEPMFASRAKTVGGFSYGLLHLCIHHRTLQVSVKRTVVDTPGLKIILPIVLLAVTKRDVYKQHPNHVSGCGQPLGCSSYFGLGCQQVLQPVGSRQHVAVRCGSGGCGRESQFMIRNLVSVCYEKQLKQTSQLTSVRLSPVPFTKTAKGNVRLNQNYNSVWLSDVPVITKVGRRIVKQ